MTLYDLINKDISCSCGRVHRCDIGTLEIGKGAILALSLAVKNKKRIFVVADENTYSVAGEKTLSILGDRVSGICIFPASPLLVPDESAIEKIEKGAPADTELILGIGSGVINDLCKYVAYGRNIPSGIIATATSMDGFASSGAAMIIGGMKVTYTTKAPDIIIGDTDILSTAPIEMVRAGYADIIGKYSALCDWKLSELINGEYLCPFVYELVMEKTNEIRALADALAQKDAYAIGTLMESLVLIGVCLTLLSTTRPGSGSEHHLSHFYEIVGLIENKPYFLHGTDVGYATAVTAALRERLLAEEKFSFGKVSDEERFLRYHEIFGNYADEVARIQDAAGWYGKPLDEIYSQKETEIKMILAECPPAKKIEKMLTDVGFEFSAFSELYGKEKIDNSIWFGKDLKDRYSVLWLYFSVFYRKDHCKNETR